MIQFPRRKRIIVDAIVDDGVLPVVQGVMDAIKEKSDLEIILVGDKARMNDALDKLKPKSRMKQLNYLANVRRHISLKGSDNYLSGSSLIDDIKGASSTRTSYEILSAGKGDALVTYINTKAAVLIANELLKEDKLRYLRRAPLCVEIPQPSGGFSLFLDAGANINDKPSDLLNYAIMADELYRNLYGTDPTIGLLTNGTEHYKGDIRVQRADRLLEEYFQSAGFGERFLGNVEAYSLLGLSDKNPDIIVTDGHTGNISIKSLETGIRALMDALKTGISKGPIRKSLIGIPFSLLGVKKDIKRKLSPSEHSGSYFLGYKKPLIIGHGASDAAAVKSSILKADTLAHLYTDDYLDLIESNLSSVR